MSSRNDQRMARGHGKAVAGNDGKLIAAKDARCGQVAEGAGLFRHISMAGQGSRDSSFGKIQVLDPLPRRDDACDAEITTPGQPALVARHEKGGA